MNQEYYLIKEAATKVGVESHVLRYWEEELKMDIHRNAMGHRYYTEKDIKVLSKVKDLKERGLQLKAIRDYLEKRRQELSEGSAAAQPDVIRVVAEDTPVKTYFEEAVEIEKKRQTVDRNENHSKKSGELVELKPHAVVQEADKMEQFQQIMNRVLSNALKENQELIGESAGRHAADVVVTKMQGMTKEQEERAEERYRKLDQTLREIQRARAEAAACSNSMDKRKQKRLKRKNIQEFSPSSVEKMQELSEK